MGRVWARYPSHLGQVAQHLRGYLRTLWASEALQEDKVREAFFVTCDKSTVTPEDIRDGHLICSCLSRARHAWGVYPLSNPHPSEELVATPRKGPRSLLACGTMLTVWAALLCIYILLANAAVAADFSGSVVAVLDGDTLEVLHNNHAERIRLNGINCPVKL